MGSSRIKQAVRKVLNRFQHGKYLVAYVLKVSFRPVFYTENQKNKEYKNYFDYLYITFEKIIPKESIFVYMIELLYQYAM